MAAGAVTVAMLAGWAPAYASSTTPPTTIRPHRPRQRPPPPTTSTSPATRPTDRRRRRRAAAAARSRPGATATPGAGGEAHAQPRRAGRPDRPGRRPHRATSPPRTPASPPPRPSSTGSPSRPTPSCRSTPRRATPSARPARRPTATSLLYQQLSTRLGEDRRALGQWAYLAYAGTGGTISDMGTLLDTLGEVRQRGERHRRPAVLPQRPAHLGRSSASRTRRQLQRAIAIKAVEASTRATEAATAGRRRPRRSSTSSSRSRRPSSTRPAQLHAEQVAKAGPVAGLLLGSGDAAAIEATKRLRAALVVPGVLADGSVKACSTNEAEYPNGKIPVAGLCPLVRRRRPEPASRAPPRRSTR